MKDAQQIQIRLLKWFGTLPLEVMQKSDTQVSNLIKAMRGLKTRQGNQCRFVPCGTHAYSRGLCAGHYSMLNSLKRITKEDYKTFIKIGICLPSHNECQWALESTREPNPNDPLRVLIRKRPPTQKSPAVE